jgi:hypothetical protein
MPQLKQHVTIIIENYQRAVKSNSATDFTYLLTQPIKFSNRSHKKQYYVRIENVRCPISFYNVNSNNNVLEWTDGVSAGSSANVTITPGNYTIDELIAELQTQMNAAVSGTYTITYNDNTQKVNIAQSATSRVSTITANSTLNKVIGFDINQTIASGGNTDGNNIAYTNTMRHIKIQIPNLISNNVYANDESLVTQVQPVGLIIPITEIRNEFQHYNNHHGPMMKLGNMSSIVDIRVKLLDPDNNVVNLNGCPFGFELVVYEYNK